MDGEKADMVFTSPPYNASSTMINGSFKARKKKDSTLYRNNETDKKSTQDFLKFNADILTLLQRFTGINKPIFYNIGYNRQSPSEYISIAANAISTGLSLMETIAWKKHIAISLAGSNLTRIFEFIFLFSNGPEKPPMFKSHDNECVKNLWEISNSKANTETHKACFPVALPEYAIKYWSHLEGILLEPFAGSGSTLIACEKTGRRCFGMEIDPHYVDVIVERYKKFCGKEVVKC
jgi:DNA modification methylase